MYRRFDSDKAITVREEIESPEGLTLPAGLQCDVYSNAYGREDDSGQFQVDI